MSESGLELTQVAVERDGFPIVRDVSLHALPGAVTVLLGANGAGKTTLLEAISGAISTTEGRIELGGRRIDHASRRARSLQGLGHVQQGRTVFSQLTVEENLRAAMGRHDDADEECYARFPELRERRGIPAGFLSGGEQQMLVLARALVSRPRILMIDEMSLGLAPMIVRRLVGLVRRLANSGVGILLVEQYASLALSIGDHAYVLSRGEIVYDGGCRGLESESDILRGAYLGEVVGDSR